MAMLKVKLINEKTPLKIKMVAKFPNVVLANLQDKETTPTKETQVVVADKTYDGLSKVTVNPIPNEYIIPSGEIEFTQNGTYDVTDKASAKVNVPEKQLGTKTITSNGTYNASDDNLDGYSEVEVATSGVDINEYFSDTITKGSSSVGGWVNTILKMRSPLTIEGTNASYMFYKYPLDELPQINTSNVTSMGDMFYGCTNLTTIPQLDTSKVTSMIRMFAYCFKITTIPELDTSNVTNMSQMFNGCSNLTTIPQINTSNVTNMRSMFEGCKNLTTIPQLDTSKVTDMVAIFNGCTKLTTIPQIDTSKVTSINQMFNGCTNLTTTPQLNGEKMKIVNSAFSNCKNLTNFNGITNLGQAYSTTQSANYSYYKLDLSSSTLLTEQSIINVLNNLYDIATKGCNTQSVVLGSTNLAKLVSEEGQQALQTATQRGWNIS